MLFKDRLSVKKIETELERQQALEVFDAVYCSEKGWVDDREAMLPREDLENHEVEWFATLVDGRIAGVCRVLYTIPIELYREYGFKLTVPGLDVEKFVSENNIAEVGRFAVLPKYRRKMMVSAMLMRAAGASAVARGASHFITDVFEDDPNTPRGFHKRVLGFQEVATHDHGELHTDSRRITMLLDLNKAAKEVSGKKGWFFRFLREENGEMAGALAN